MALLLLPALLLMLVPPLKPLPLCAMLPRLLLAAHAAWRACASALERQPLSAEMRCVVVWCDSGQQGWSSKIRMRGVTGYGICMHILKADPAELHACKAPETHDTTAACCTGNAREPVLRAHQCGVQKPAHPENQPSLNTNTPHSQLIKHHMPCPGQATAEPCMCSPADLWQLL